MGCNGRREEERKGRRKFVCGEEEKERKDRKIS